ncbi:T9SS type A sorting domain-containing protein [candidate division WOR-3 bacterium]|nr:T9SS type A sorting domain-containing protein [candidate division WOR-3 bacterium]
MNRTHPIAMTAVALLLAALSVGLAKDLPVPECGVPHLPPARTDYRIPRPTLSGPVSFRNKTNVRVHYTTSGSDATTILYAESVAVFAESCWARGARLGWINPPGDYGVGGDNRFDIYLRHSDNLGAYGVSMYDTANTTYYPDGWCTWVEICTDSIPQPFRRYNRLKALVAHEFHHSVQQAYSENEEPKWAFYENTSVWVEDVLWPGNGTLYWRNNSPTSYTTNPLTYTYYSTNSIASTYEYPGGLWPLFLTEYFSGTTVRRIWELCGNHVGNHILKDIDSVLVRDFGVDLHTAYGHYAIWRYFTGNRDDNLHYARADECTTAMLLRTHSTYPASGNEGTWDPYGPGGMDLVEFTTNGSQTLTISFNGQNGYTWRAYVLARRGSTTYEQRIMLDANGDGSIVIPSWMITTAVLIPVVVHWTDGMNQTPALTFTYSASVSDEPTGFAGTNATRPALEMLAANPVRGPATIRYVLPPGADGVLRITDAAGRLVQESALHGTGRPASVGLKAVPAGIYFCRLDSGGETIHRKLVLE